MKILSKKNYEKLQNCLSQLQTDYNNSRCRIRLYEKQIIEKNNLVEKLGCDIDDYKKEIKYLKTLLTKNGIIYKKEK